MKLTLKNIAKFDKIAIELNGITVIAGENNTGKSTIGKALFCIFNGFYELDIEIEQARKNLLRRAIFVIFNGYNKKYEINDKAIDEICLEIKRGTNDEIIKELIKKNSNINSTYEDLENFEIGERIVDNELIINDELIKELKFKVEEILKISSKSIFINILQKKFNDEFSGQINNILSEDTEGKISLQIKNNLIEITIKDNKIVDLENLISLKTQAVYLDDPFILDELSNIMIKLSKKSNYLNHRDHLKYCLLKRKNVNTVEQSIQEEIIENKFNNILEKIDAISEEKLERTFIGEKNLFENEKSNKKILEIKNLSTGLKSFMLIKNLIVNGYIEENGTIILDEPEVHLHPEWQILFAEIIVLLQKEYNMHILLATHSPYFLNAIEVYSKKYKILDKCKYYLTEKEKNVFKIFDVSEDTEQIYKKLVKPFKKLESLENEDENN